MAVVCGLFKFIFILLNRPAYNNNNDAKQQNRRQKVMIIDINFVVSSVMLYTCEVKWRLSPGNACLILFYSCFTRQSEATDNKRIQL